VLLSLGKDSDLHFLKHGWDVINWLAFFDSVLDFSEDFHDVVVV